MIAPPEEELPSPAGLLLDDEDDLLEEEDFSYASMFASLTNEGEGDSLLEDLANTNQQQSSSFFMGSPLIEASKPKGSIGLGSLLVGPTTTSILGSGGTLGQLTGVAGGMTPPPSASSTGAGVGVGGSSSMVAPPNAMTSEELEAQLLGRPPPSIMPGGAPQQQQQQQQQYAPPPPLPPHMMMMRPPPPPPPGMMMHQPGVFTLDMIEAAGQQQQQQQHRPPPPHPHMMAMMPPPPPQQQQPMPLGAGMMMMPRGPPGRALGAPPPPPPPNQQGGGYANLAQRLKALNLAEPHQEAAQQAVQQYHRHTSMMQHHNNNYNNNMAGNNQGGGRFGSKYMPGPEIENILSMQFRAVSGVPYTEDYYYQAFVYKYYEQRNKRVFAPESVRELNPTEKAAPGEVSFVKLEGLGKVPFSNIRRPRPLMDIATAPPPPGGDGGKKEGEEDGSDGDNKDASASATVRPLDQEPLLAARIMIEDCMCLVLDVLDVDAIFSAAKNGQEIENVEALRTRRALLLEGLAASMRLPDDALVDEEAEKKKKKKKKDSKKKTGEDETAGTGSSIEAGDGVFLRLTTLPKGKALVARALKVIYPPPQSVGAVEGIEPNLRVLWAVMRNARALFGGRRVAAGKQEEDTAVSAKIATAMIDTISKLHSPQALCSTLEAAMHGDLYVDSKALKANPEAVLLPLTPPSSSTGGKKDEELPWLKDVITALLNKAGEMDIKGSVGDSPGKKDSDEIKQWYKDTERLYEVTMTHLSALSEALEAAKKMKEEEAIVEVKALVPVKMGETLLEHCGKKKRKELDGVLQKLAK